MIQRATYEFRAKSFLFLRHGETDWNAKGVFQGRADISLNEVGKQQAQQAATRLRKTGITRIVCSPLKRAHQTALEVAKATGLQINFDPNIIECDFGSLDGTSIATAMSDFGITRKEDLASILPSDGEKWTDVRKRSMEALSHHLNLSSGATVLFVANDAVLQSIAEQLCGSWFDAKHGKPYRFVRNFASWRVAEI